MRYLAKSTVPDYGEGWTSSGHRGVARRREAFLEVPPENEAPDAPRSDNAWHAARLKIVGAADSPRVQGRPTAVSLRPENARRGFHRPGPGNRKILTHIGQRFDPLKLPGRSPTLFDDFFPDSTRSAPFCRADTRDTLSSRNGINSNPMVSCGMERSTSIRPQ